MQSAMLAYVATTMTPRELAGSVVRDERARQGLKVASALERLRISRAALGKMEAGREVGDLVLRSIEGGLGLPTHLLSYIIDSDEERIKRLPSKTDDPLAGIREDLRLYILEAMGEMDKPRNRRSTDRNGNRRNG